MIKIISIFCLLEIEMVWVEKEKGKREKENRNGNLKWGGKLK